MLKRSMNLMGLHSTLRQTGPKSLRSKCAQDECQPHRPTTLIKKATESNKLAPEPSFPWGPWLRRYVTELFSMMTRRTGIMGGRTSTATNQYTVLRSPCHILVKLHKNTNKRWIILMSGHYSYLQLLPSDYSSGIARSHSACCIGDIPLVTLLPWQSHP